jgi:hypothetical protein
MSEIKIDKNNEILINAVKKLQLRFPVADIQRATGYEKGSISSFLNNKKPVSDNFLQTFSEAFNIDLREFGFTKGLIRLPETKNPQPNGEGLKDKMIQLLETSLARVEAELNRVLQENERLKNK